ncbi:unnamed protein product [Enterobius vermicularis]|uniref:LRRcap domain-containing protein n=1 Tax=Enterobius vermicularis TaxID=51028 RepID=A0A0N4VMX3_ENTVE|nr:unnamed protein product [Enterobius vermicularis]
MNRLCDLLLEPDFSESVEDAESWSCIEDVDFSFNELTEVDESVRLLENVKKIDMSHNILQDIGHHLQHLTCLTELNLSHNNIENLVDWHLKLGNLKKLYLAGNSVSSVTDNKISSPEDVLPVGSLPCLEHIILRGNPIRQVVEYRTKVLELFGDRAAEVNRYNVLERFEEIVLNFMVRLDSRKPGLREIDTVAVRVALRKAQIEKEKKEQSKKVDIDRKIRLLSAGTLDTMSSRSL